MTVREFINALLTYDDIDTEIDVSVISIKNGTHCEMKSPLIILDKDNKIIIEGD